MVDIKELPRILLAVFVSVMLFLVTLTVITDVAFTDFINPLVDLFVYAFIIAVFAAIIWSVIEAILD